MTALQICLVSRASDCALFRACRSPTPEPLSSDEFAALKALSVSLPPPTIPGDIESRLLQLGYIEEVLGNLVLTDEGVKRIDLGK
ncbi:MAG: hypothetical protein JWP25_7529 [Bradyrhizobium sp.]|jgi:hypothetical protein|nr:hypothetical protein [Bradyrhizobium sp.]